ncbi:HpcH/HpaI aldolase/citrate lyase family protein [Roseateles sp. UC29_93]|uniref:HpcH/HpaI aldolase/citrate lyase family protein n=1 Tax=Roseateles sp. UC29_93 TaxID=3350177 RepID=UPI00366E376E
MNAHSTLPASTASTAPSHRFYRSYLFVPADNERLLQSALNKTPDVVILDLEDGVHPSRKAAARAGVATAIGRVHASGKAAAVRVNGALNTAIDDLRAAVSPGLRLLVLPKVEHARDVQLLAGVVDELERSAGLPASGVRFLLQIESAAALPRLHDIAAASPRVHSMMLGSEDFSLDVGGLPTPQALLTPSLMVLYAARAAGVLPVGFVGSIANLGNVEDFEALLRQARSLGFRGAVVVHPKFVDAINACYTPTPEQVAQARAIVAAFDIADRDGLGATKLGDLMIDKPVVLRAKALLIEAGLSPLGDG